MCQGPTQCCARYNTVEFQHSCLAVRLRRDNIGKLERFAPHIWYKFADHMALKGWPDSLPLSLVFCHF